MTGVKTRQLIDVSSTLCLQAPQIVKYGRIGFSDKTITARNIIIATGSVPFVPPGIEVDGKKSWSLVD